MQPDSVLLVAALLAVCVGLLYLVLQMRHLAVRIACAALTLPVAMASGIAVVNDYFGYYRTWSALASDLSGNYAGFAPATAVTQPGQAMHGRVERIRLDGAASGISRPGLVYLPPQYGQRRYAHTDFPVVELVHGTPGAPSQWIVQLRLAALADQLASQYKIGPMVLVMPADYSGTQFEEGVNTSSALDDTYLSRDVPNDVMRRFRVSHDRSMWGIAGFSSGGYVAANLALRHRSGYGAAAIMDGYFRPQDGEAARIIGTDRAALAANNPLLAASRLRPGIGPLPAFWIAAGTGIAVDIHGADAFAAALRRSEQLSFVVEPRAHHTFYSWEAALPHLLAWSWQQLASPALRVAFPVTGVSSTYTVHVPKRRYALGGLAARGGDQRAPHPLDRKPAAAGS